MNLIPSSFVIGHFVISSSFVILLMESKRSLRDFSMLIALVIICAFFAVMSPQFLGARNLSLLMTELSITATLALACC